MLDCCVQIPGPGGGDGAAGVCLEDYKEVADSSFFSTNATTPQATAKGFGLLAYQGGNYQIEVTYTIEGYEFNRFLVNLGLDGAPPANEVFTEDHKEEVWDDDNNEAYVYGRSVFNFPISAGNHTLDIYFWVDGGAAQTIADTCITLWRVS